MIFWIILLITFIIAGAYTALAGFTVGRLIAALVIVYLTVNLIYVLASCVGAVGIDKKKKIEKQSKLCRNGIIRLADYFDAYLRLDITVSGVEKLPTDRRFLYVSNHRSMLDPVVVMDKLGDYNIPFVCKPSLTKLPILWRLAHGAGFMAVDRENNREALKTVVNAAELIKKDECSMGIYPEGTRSKTEEMLPFRNGAFKIAQRAEAPLVIASIRGTEKIKKNYPLRRTKIYLNIIEVMSAEDVKALSTAELSEHSRRLIEESLREDA